MAALRVSQPKAEIQPTIATAIAVTYPITKSRFNIVPLLTAEPARINSVTLFMATLLRLNYADWAPSVANRSKDLVTHLLIGRLAIGLRGGFGPALSQRVGKRKLNHLRWIARARPG